MVLEWRHEILRFFVVQKVFKAKFTQTTYTQERLPPKFKKYPLNKALLKKIIIIFQSSKDLAYDI